MIELLQFVAVIERIGYVQSKIGEQASSALALSEGFRLGMKHRRAELEKMIKRSQAAFSELDTIEHYVRATKARIDEIRLQLVQELKNHDAFYLQTKKRDGHMDYSMKLMDVTAVDMVDTWEALNQQIKKLELENSKLRQQLYVNVSLICFHTLSD